MKDNVGLEKEEVFENFLVIALIKINTSVEYQ